MHTKEKIVREDDLAALERAKQAGYELRDYQLGGIVYTLGALTLLAIAGFALMGFTYKSFEKIAPHMQTTESYSNLSFPVKPETQHRLTVDLTRELAEVREGEKKNLETYGYADQAAGLGRIPVDRALEMIADHGALPVFAAGGAASFPAGAVPPPAHGAEAAHPPATGGAGATHGETGAAPAPGAGDAAHGATAPASPGASPPGFTPQFEPEVHQAFPEGQH